MVLIWDGRGPCLSLVFGSPWKTNSNLVSRTADGPTELLGGMRPEALKGPAGNWALTTSSPSYPKQKHAVSERGWGVREIVQLIGYLPFT